MKHGLQRVRAAFDAAVAGIGNDTRQRVSLAALLATAVVVLVAAFDGKTVVAGLGGLVIAVQLLLFLQMHCGIRLRWPQRWRRRTPLRIPRRPG